MERFELYPYLMPTRFGAARGIVLAIRLLKAAPEAPPPRVRVALEGVRGATVNLQTVAIERLRVGPQSLRPLDIALDNTLMGLSEALAALARLGGEDGARASDLHRTIYPNGTGFVKANYDEEWAATAAMLSLIETDGLAPDIDDLAGARYLPAIRAAHLAYGEALGLGATTPELPDTTAAKAGIDALAKAIAEYGRVMVGALDWDDEASIATFRRAMAPLDAYRRSLAGNRGGVEEPEIEPDAPTEEEDVSPTDPIPVIEPAPAPA